jgi:hypothetical protein
MDSNSASAGRASCGSASRYGSAPKHGDEQPEGGHHQVALAGADALPPAGHAPEPGAEAGGERRRKQERPHRLAVAERDARREQEGEAR